MSVVVLFSQMILRETAGALSILLKIKKCTLRIKEKRNPIYFYLISIIAHLNYHKWLGGLQFWNDKTGKTNKNNPKQIYTAAELVD